ncbi:uncharacterized protein LOC116124372 [Pistacia vera]|uniref:uncharacterized protein LOC116124372 n=1 Tax=Pistacia vera TaxID=55513 RepID=UPI001262F598|nr:uncharacterized protein LOC116124372 [Pistacia vera]
MTPQQNGLLERKNRVLQEMARVMLNAKKLPKRLRAEAINTACHISNTVFLRKDYSEFSQEEEIINITVPHNVTTSQDVVTTLNSPKAKTSVPTSVFSVSTARAQQGQALASRSDGLLLIVDLSDEITQRKASIRKDHPHGSRKHTYHPL